MSADKNILAKHVGIRQQYRKSPETFSCRLFLTPETRPSGTALRCGRSHSKRLLRDLPARPQPVELIKRDH
jgi:hypothetical protein